MMCISFTLLNHDLSDVLVHDTIRKCLHFKGKTELISFILESWFFLCIGDGRSWFWYTRNSYLSCKTLTSHRLSEKKSLY